MGYRDGREGEGRSSLEEPSARFGVLLEAMRPCLRRAWIPGAPAGRMHLLAEKLTPRGASQLGLFEDPGGRAERVGEVKRDINTRHGRFAVRSTATLPLAKVYADPANGYDICDVKG